MRPSIASALLLTSVTLIGAACHTMRFQLVDEPVAQTLQERKSYFFWGLAPTQEVDVLSKCPGGAVAVRERTTFVDGLLQLPTLGIWCPRSTTYYCRAASPAGSHR